MKKPSWFTIVLFICLLFSTSTSVYQALELTLPKNRTTPELERVISDIQVELRYRGIEFNRKDIIFKFYKVNSFSNKIMSTSVAYFYPAFSGKFIAIDKENFDKATPEVREALILHEIAHSMGVFQHDDSWKWFGMGRGAVLHLQSKSCAISVMHSSDNMAGCFDQFKGYYYDEVVAKIKAAKTINKILDTVTGQ